MNGRLHVSVPTEPSSGLLMNQVINAAYMLGAQHVRSLLSVGTGHSFGTTEAVA
jgi:hypothetical protein